MIQSHVLIHKLLRYKIIPSFPQNKIRVFFNKKGNSESKDIRHAVNYSRIAMVRVVLKSSFSRFLGLKKLLSEFPLNNL